MQEFEPVENVVNALGGDEVALEGLLIDIAKMEVTGWIETMIDFLAFDPRKDEMLPPHALETWRSIGPMKQEMAFLMLLGSIKALMEPPEEAAVYVS